MTEEPKIVAGEMPFGGAEAMTSRFLTSVLCTIAVKSGIVCSERGSTWEKLLKKLSYCRSTW